MAVTALQPQSVVVFTPQNSLLLQILFIGRCRALKVAIALGFTLLNGLMAQADEPCVITNEGDRFSVVSIQTDDDEFITMTWESCANYIYGVLSSDQPDAGAFWSGQIAMWGEDGSTGWTDTTVTTNVDHRFYRIVRMPPDGDFDEDEMPNAWELQYGLNLFDPDDAQADLNGDGVNNLTAYLQGRDPTKGAVADSEGLVNLNVFTPLE
jgi:hypothetical protein